MTDLILPTAKTIYEYEVRTHLHHKDCNDDELVMLKNELNTLGADGWLLSAVIHIDMPPYVECKFIFVREVK